MRLFFRYLFVFIVFSTSFLVAAEVQVPCQRTDFFQTPGSTYHDLGHKDPRFKKWLIDTLKLQKRGKGARLQIHQCQISHPYPEDNFVDGLRTVFMYWNWFDEKANAYSRRGIKMVYSAAKKSKNGKPYIARKVKAFAECEGIETCIRMGIYLGAPVRTDRDVEERASAREEKLAPIPNNTRGMVPVKPRKAPTRQELWPDPAPQTKKEDAPRVPTPADPRQREDSGRPKLLNPWQQEEPSPTTAQQDRFVSHQTGVSSDTALRDAKGWRAVRGKQ